MWPFDGKYKFDRRYARTFLTDPLRDAELPLRPAPEVVYCFWTGDNPMSENRHKAFESMRVAIGTGLKLITPGNLSEYIVPGHPLHPGYEYLSFVHRSDYLRTYFMHHHGGGYADIKRYSHSWDGVFEQLNDSDGWALGYREIGARGVVRLPGRTGRDIKRNWWLFIGLGAFVFRPGTPLTAEWYDELDRRMDGYFEALKRTPGNVMGDNKGYPIRWSGILGDIYFPTAFRYHDRLLMNDAVKPSFENYR